MPPAAMRRMLLVALAAAFPAAALGQSGFAPRAPQGGGPAPHLDAVDGVTDAERVEIQREIDANVARLRAEGRLPEASSKAAVAMGWPTRDAVGTDPGYFGISNYVDRTSGGGISDWNCGGRSYDGHRGLDVFSWPFSWAKMDANEVEIVAAAPGTIVNKTDGNPDRSCQWQGAGNWNAVYVRHADGSTAWYGHLRTNSLTPKPVGATVAAGETLGVMGSSGRSTGPHLHLEVYDANNALVDPYSGSCNSAATWWADQEDYYVSQIVALKTHGAAPRFASCPGTTDTPNLQDRFDPGDAVYFGAYFRDQRQGQPAQYRVTNPSGATVWSWSASLAVPHYSASWWYWSNALPANAPLGTWTFTATYQGETVSWPFTVGDIATSGEPGTAAVSITPPAPNPAVGATRFTVDLPAAAEVSITVVDVLGREAAVLHDGALAAGRRPFEIAGLAPGTYSVRVRAAGVDYARPFTIAR